MGVMVRLTCKDCGKTAGFELNPADAIDWGWLIFDEIRDAGFKTSEKATYCIKCASTYKKGLLGIIED